MSLCWSCLAWGIKIKQNPRSRWTPLIWPPMMQSILSSVNCGQLYDRYQMIDAPVLYILWASLSLESFEIDRRNERIQTIVKCMKCFVLFLQLLFLSVFRFFATVLSVFCSIRNNAGPKSQFNQETVAAARIFYNNVTYTQKRATWWISASRQKHAPKESIKKYGKKTKVEVCGLCSNRCIQRYTQHIDWNNCIFWR